MFTTVTRLSPIARLGPRLGARPFTTTLRTSLPRKNDYVPASLPIEHRPSLGNSSMGHLFSELSSSKEGMEGRGGMSEEERRRARLTMWGLMGVPAAVVGVIGAYGLWNKVFGGEGE